MPAPRVLLVDNYDSFTYNLRASLIVAGADCSVVLCDDDKLLRHDFAGDFDGILLSPGPGKPADSGHLMRVIEEHVMTIPFFGICLGHQALGEYFGAELKQHTPRHGKTSMISHTGYAMFDSLASPLEVMRYHSLILKQPLPASLMSCATTDDDILMAFVHSELPVWGVQFHPESILTPSGNQMLANWVKSLF